jgi:hypothetical protein
MIGDLDSILSKIILFADDYDVAKTSGDLQTTANYQTLKHHAEDMIGAGQKVLKLMGIPDRQEQINKLVDHIEGSEGFIFPDEIEKRLREVLDQSFI